MNEYKNYRPERNKGIREYQHIVNFFLCIDYSRKVGGYRKLAKLYKLNENNIRARIITFKSKYQIGEMKNEN